MYLYCIEHNRIRISTGRVLVQLQQQYMSKYKKLYVRRQCMRGLAACHSPNSLRPILYSTHLLDLLTNQLPINHGPTIGVRTDVDAPGHAKRQQQGPAPPDRRVATECMLNKHSSLCSVDISYSGPQTS